MSRFVNCVKDRMTSKSSEKCYFDAFRGRHCRLHCYHGLCNYCDCNECNGIRCPLATKFKISEETFYLCAVLLVLLCHRRPCSRYRCLYKSCYSWNGVDHCCCSFGSSEATDDTEQEHQKTKKQQKKQHQQKQQQPHKHVDYDDRCGLRPIINIQAGIVNYYNGNGDSGGSHYNSGRNVNVAGTQNNGDVNMHTDFSHQGDLDVKFFNELRQCLCRTQAVA